MNCDIAQERLFANGGETPAAELAAHLAVCSTCRELSQRTIALDAWIRKIPVPGSRSARKHLISRMTMTELVRPANTTRIPWKWAGVLAAGVVITVTAWQIFRGSGSQQAIAAKPRHELLNRQTNHLVQLAQSDSAPKRLAVWTDWMNDIRTETRELYKVAPGDDLSALSQMFDRTIHDGIVSQVQILAQLNDVHDRHSLMRNADDTLAETQAELDRMSREAPPEAREYLRRMSKSAREGRQKLHPLLTGA